MMVDKTGVGPTSSSVHGQNPPGGPGGESPAESGAQSLSNSRDEEGDDEVGRDDDEDDEDDEDEDDSKRDSAGSSDKSPGDRTKSNQRWMKLRTTVQISGAITSTIQKTKPPLKREDSFLKRFSTRQIPETQETVDTGDDGDSGTSQSANNARRRRRRRQQRLPISVVNPDENFYFYWLFVLSGCVLYNLWTLIVRQSFPELQSGANVFWFSCDGFTDTIFLLDVAVQFRTGYLEQGLMVYDSKKLAGHYMKSRAFIFDLCALIPLDLLQFTVGVNPILRFPRFLKVYRVYDYYYMVESRTVYPNLWRVVNLIHILLILAHWFGCFYFLLSEAEGFKGDWVYPYRPGDYATLTRKYLGSLYWSTLTLTTIGDLPTPETNSEYLFTIVSYLIGVFIFATIVGQVGNVITNRNANRLEFERLLDGAKTYMRHHKVPGGMKRRVLRWYDYSWSRGRIQGGGDINTALGLLPDKLKTELALHVNLSVLKKVTIFQECQPEFLHDLVLKMKAYIFTPGDSICRKGEVAREMFIIADGILEVMSETGRVLTTMKAGDFFGEIGILNLDGLNKRTADVRSVGYSELFSLSREDVLAAMKDYPEAQEILQSLGRKRLMEARGMNRPKVGAHLEKGLGMLPHAVIAGGEDSSAGKRIVEKLRSDVKGLKNVLRKSRRGPRTRDESFELQPLNPGSIDTGLYDASHSGGKGMLRRMSRVRSDDGEDDADPSSPSEKLSSGLPLLSRLRHLKEKQDREEKGRVVGGQPTAPFTAPAIKLEQAQEVIGAGLPLIQRLLLLKQKEAMQATAAHAAEVLASSCKAKDLKSPPKEPEEHVSSTEHSDEDGSRKTTSLLTRLVSLKHKDSGISSINSSTVSTVSQSPNESKPLLKDKSKLVPNEVKPLDGKVDVVAAKGALFKEKLRMLTHKDVKSGDAGRESEVKGDSVTKSSPTVPKIPLFKEKLKLLTHKDVKAEVQEGGEITKSGVVPKVTLSSGKGAVSKDSLLPPAVPLRKQESWSVLKKAAILKTPSHSIEGINSSCGGGGKPRRSRADDKGGAADESSATRTSASDTMPSKDPEGEQLTAGACAVDENPSDSCDVFAQNLGENVLDSGGDKVAIPTTVRERCVSESDHAGEPSAQRKKPNILDIKQETKFYMSIDDLSPEYSGLPFVKKLKILNERQKLAELEREVAYVFMRSCSLDSGSGGADDVDLGLTRSHSEACAMEYVRTQQRTRDHRQLEQEKAQRPTDLPKTVIEPPADAITSPESNETLERRHLKSILKKLSAGSQMSEGSEENSGAEEGEEEVTEPPVAKPSPAEIRKLMRAPTIEGYAARHSKLTKSVTFNRETLPSPPVDLPVTTIESSETPSVSVAAGDNETDATVIPSMSKECVKMLPCSVSEEVVRRTISETAVVDSIKTTMTTEVQTPLKKARPPHHLAVSQKNFQLMLPEEEYFGEVLVGIRQVIQGHLEEIQNKFLTQFQSMEMEVRRRDEIISQLQHRIQELEQPNLTEDENDEDGDISDLDDTSDQPFMRENSVDTVLTSPPPRIPEEELEEMLVLQRRHPTSPQRLLESHRHSWEDHSEEETLELQDLPKSITPLPWYPDEVSDRNSTAHLPRPCDSDSVAVNVGSDTESSEDDDAFTCDEISGYRSHNRDWEVQMLARELERREDVSKLENEVAVLKAAVSATELTRLSTTELDVLEKALVEEDRKICAAARAQSFDSDESQTEVPTTAIPKKFTRQKSTNGANSDSNLIHRAGVLKNKLLPGHGARNSIRRKLMNAKSLEEQSESQASSSSPNVCRNRSSSSGNIPMPTSQTTRSSFVAAGNLMRGIGHFVRNVSTTQTRQSTSGDVERAVMTISETCGSTQFTEEPPTPPPDL